MVREKSGEGVGSWVLHNECEQRGATEALSWGVGVLEGWYFQRIASAVKC